jgi:hypothetical protein
LKVCGHELSRKLERGEDGATTRALLLGHLAVCQHLVPHLAEVAVSVAVEDDGERYVATGLQFDACGVRSTRPGPKLYTAST